MRCPSAPRPAPPQTQSEAMPASSQSSMPISSTELSSTPDMVCPFHPAAQAESGGLAKRQPDAWRVTALTRTGDAGGTGDRRSSREGGEEYGVYLLAFRLRSRRLSLAVSDLPVSQGFCHDHLNVFPSLVLQNKGWKRACQLPLPLPSLGQIWRYSHRRGLPNSISRPRL